MREGGIPPCEVRSLEKGLEVEPALSTRRVATFVADIRGSLLRCRGRMRPVSGMLKFASIPSKPTFTGRYSTLARSGEGTEAPCPFVPGKTL